MAGSLLPQPKQMFQDANWNPLIGGQIYTYAAGTLTPKATYQDAGLTISNTNPALANARGEVVMFGAGPYRIILKDAPGNVIYDVDNIEGARSMIDTVIASLASLIGSSLIGFIQAGTGAFLRTVQDKLRESVSVADFMSSDQRAAAKDPAATLDHSDAFMRAYNASNTVTVPPGFYNVENLKFNKDNFSLIGAGYNQSILRSKAAAGICIEVANTANVSGLKLKDFKIEGTVDGAGGIKLGSEGFYCAIPMLENVGVWNYSRVLVMAGFGIQLYRVQNVTIHNCWIYRNRYGIHHPNAAYATATKISGKSGYVGGNFVGIYIDGFYDDLYIDDLVIESNTGGGVWVTVNAVRPDRGSNIFINGAYFEANGVDGSGAIAIEGGAGAYQPHVVVLERLYFAANTAPFVNLNRVIATIRNCKLTPGQVRTTANCSVRFDSNKFPTGSNYLTEYRALLGNISVTDTVDPALATDLNQINLFNSITFPVVSRPVNDPHTLDDYQERVLGQWTPVAIGFGGSISSITGRYIKVGRMIHIQYLITASSLSSVWTVSEITLPFPALAPSVLSLFNGSNGVSMGNAYIDAGTDRVLTPTWGATNAVLVASGSYTVDE